MEKIDVSPRHENPWLTVCLLLAPLLIMVSKLPVSPISRGMNELFSLADIPQRLHGHVEYVLFLPLSAIVVCIFRLTLGLPVLSLFRPILLAVAFRVIGIPWALAFLLMVLGFVVIIKPLIKDAHYYVRVPLIMSLVAAFLVIPLIAGKRWHIWPTVNTVAAAMVIALLAGFPGAMPLLLSYPEVLFLQAGVILLIGKYLDLRLFEERNPFLPRRRPEPNVGALVQLSGNGN